MAGDMCTRHEVWSIESTVWNREQSARVHKSPGAQIPVTAVKVAFVEDGEKRRVSKAKEWRIRHQDDEEARFISYKLETRLWPTGAQTNNFILPW